MDQPRIPLLIFFWILFTCLLDILLIIGIVGVKKVNQGTEESFFFWRFQTCFVLSSELNLFRYKRKKCLWQNWEKLKCVRKRGKRNSRIYRNSSQLLRIKQTHTDWSKCISARLACVLSLGAKIFLSFTVAMRTYSLLCSCQKMKLVEIDRQLWLNVEPLFHSGWHETVDRESWRLSKYSVIHLIIIFFTRRDKKQVKKKQTKKKGELGDKPVKVKRLIKGFKSLFLQQVKCSLFSCTVCTCNFSIFKWRIEILGHSK